MTQDTRLQVILAALGFLFLTMSTGVGVLVRLTLRWGKIENKLETIADKIGDLIRIHNDDNHELEKKIEKVDTRIERHEEWHRDNPSH